MLARFTRVDYDRDLVLIALDGGAIVAVARYVANPERDSAEFAIIVADAWQGRGLGYALMQMLIRQAAKRGLRRLTGNVLIVNAPMLALAATLGFVAKPDPRRSRAVRRHAEAGPARELKRRRGALLAAR
jgi:acetyltransferase